MSLAGASLLTTTARVLGLDRGLSKRLSAWTPVGAIHDTGKIILDLAVALAVGGDCPADVAVLRGQPRLFGAVASDPTVSRRVNALAGNVDEAVAAIRSARAQARALRLKWAPLPGNVAVPVDIDATILIAHSDKEDASPTYKRTFGHAPLLAYLDHGEGGTGEPLAVLLRPGRANANNAADNIAVLREALTQLPKAERDQVLVRTDAAGGTHAFLQAVTDLGWEYSVGFAVTAPVAKAVRDLPEWAWAPAYDGAHAAPARPRPRLTTPRYPVRHRLKDPGPVEPRHPGATAGFPDCSTTANPPVNQQMKITGAEEEDHETPRRLTL